MASVAPRLPGIRIDVAPPPPAEVLPRMDVAVLVGFAATGPLHIPVVVESVTQFAAVFGGDAPLAWDEGRAERAYACLAPAVRAFFANGGRRCWVIRVARTAALEALKPGGSPRLAVARANRFAIPGVLALNAAGELEPALAQARSEGSWSDRYAVTAALASPSFDVELESMTSPATGRFGVRTRYGIHAGDLLELRTASGAITYAAVDRVSVATQPGGPYHAVVTAVAAFEPLTVSPASPPEPWGGEASVASRVKDVAAELSAPLTAEGEAHLRFLDAIPAGLGPGYWASWSDGIERVWLRMDSLETSPVPAVSPPEPAESWVQAVGRGPAWLELEVTIPSEPIVRASVLTLELRVTGTGDVAMLTGVGLTPAHPAAWWRQLTDAELYRPDEWTGAGDADPALPDDVPRFPLARADGPPPLAWVPLGVAPLFGDALAPLPEEGTPLERDGLAPFAPDLFLDPELANVAVDAIPELADAIRFVRKRHRLLLGMHAGLSVGRGGLFNEATLLGIPDAVHTGWERRSVAAVIPPQPAEATPPASWAGHRGPCARPAPAAMEGPDFGVFLDCHTRVVPPPVLYGGDESVPPGAYRLEWTSAAPHGTYVLLEATQPDFSSAREVYRGPDTAHVALQQGEGVYYYQVSVLADGERSADSNAVAVQVRADEWVVRDPAIGTDEFEPAWLALHRAALRLAAASGDLFAALALPRHFRTEQAQRYTQRLRGVKDPRSDDGRATDGDAFDLAEARALSYGAVYFPWLSAAAKLPSAVQTGADGAPPTRRTLSGQTTPTLMPPDGAALGVLAGRASDRGAWVCAANQPLRDVVALYPSIPSSDRLRLQEARINLVREDARGFLTLSAATLAQAPELVPINVRRLLTLLRRLCLRRGQSYVFEPHGPALRRAVERAFDTVLTELFRRGAFAGVTPEEGFRVVVDDTVNPPASVEAGRLVVELRVAPSRPLTFLTVRLAQSGPRLTVTEEL